MSIVKHEIPILEVDSSFSAVINPTHENLDLQLPQKCVYAFVGEYINQYAQEHGGVQVSSFVSITKEYPIYVIQHKGEKVVLCQAPMGAPAATQLMDWLIGYGVRQIVSTGSCGALENLPEGTFFIPFKALRDEGTYYHYLAPSRFIETSQKVRECLEQTMKAYNLPYQEVITWTTDGFFRETAEMVKYRREEGCSVVEMECSALAACSAFRGVDWGMILYTADTLHNTEQYDERNWGGNSYELALRLCLDAIVSLKGRVCCGMNTSAG